MSNKVIEVDSQEVGRLESERKLLLPIPKTTADAASLEAGRLVSRSLYRSPAPLLSLAETATPRNCCSLPPAARC